MRLILGFAARSLSGEVAAAGVCAELGRAVHRLVRRLTPCSTDAARAAKVSGTVILECVVHKDGLVSVNRVVRGVGYGLDENAKAAIERWVKVTRSVGLIS